MRRHGAKCRGLVFGTGETNCVESELSLHSVIQHFTLVYYSAADKFSAVLPGCIDKCLKSTCFFFFPQALDRAKPGMEDGKNAAQSRSFKRLVCNQFNAFSKTIVMKLAYSC